ncbi:MAG: DUF4384 domain-containing protein [Rhodospirillaceae bacterium]
MSGRAKILSSALVILTVLLARTPVAGAEPTAPAPIPLMIDNAGNADPAKLLQSLSGVAPATLKTTGRFTWNVGRDEMINPVGDLVATVGGGDLEARIARVQGVIDKWTVLRSLERTPRADGLEMRLEPGRDLYHAGDKEILMVEGLKQPYFTLLNIASDGTVNLLYPLDTAGRRDSPALPTGALFKLPFQVTPPFGADHFVAIASAVAPVELHGELKAIDGKPEALVLPDLFDKYLNAATTQIGTLGVLSAR